MDTATWISLFAAMGVWVGILGSIFVFVNRGLSGRFDKIQAQLARGEKDHEALRVQITDLSRSFSESYVRRVDFDSAINGFHAAIGEARKDIGGVGSRIDDLFRTVEWRQRDHSG